MTTGNILERLFVPIVVVALLADSPVPAAEPSTVGLAPPDGAVVLFDGSNFDAWKPFSWQWINPHDDQK